MELHAPRSSTKMMVPRSNEDPAKEQTPLQAISQGVCLPGIPLFSSIDKQRAWILSHMAGAFRVFARKGFTEGMSGHISVRDPENPHTFWTNPLGKHFATLKASDMILVDYDGKVVGGNTSRPANAAGFLIHSAVHAARPDVHAACHCHGKAGKAWSAFGRKLEMINQDVTYFYGDAQAVYAEFGGVVLDKAEGERLAAALGPKGKGMILRNHGLLVGDRTARRPPSVKRAADESRRWVALSTKPPTCTRSWSGPAKCNLWSRLQRPMGLPRSM